MTPITFLVLWCIGSTPAPHWQLSWVRVQVGNKMQVSPIAREASHFSTHFYPLDSFFFTYLVTSERRKAAFRLLSPKNWGEAYYYYYYYY